LDIGGGNDDGGYDIDALLFELQGLKD